MEGQRVHPLPRLEVLEVGFEPGGWPSKLLLFKPLPKATQSAGPAARPGQATLIASSAPVTQQDLCPPLHRTASLLPSA